MNKYLHKYTENLVGHDYLVGDIHGHYSELMESLEGVGFNFKVDRLFSVGDLGDRGDESEKVIQLIEEDWFIAVRGNHDQFILDQYEHERVMLYGGFKRHDPAYLHRSNEGDWFFKFDDSCRQYLANVLMSLPYVIELSTHGYKIGISHAGVPIQYQDWNEFVGDLNNRNTRELCLRTRKHAELHQNGIDRVLLGVDYTIHGHTAFQKPVFTTFSAFIDTFDKSGKLTVLSVSALVEKLNVDKDWRVHNQKRQLQE